MMNPFIKETKLHAQSLHLARVEYVKGFPSDEAGIEKGVSACFAGTVDNMLLMAGGCNFPEKPAAEGGLKRYYQGIYAAEITRENQLKWTLVGKLPQPCAYGVSIPLPSGLLCIGGNNLNESFDSVFEIILKDGKATLKQFPSLPVKMDNFAGACDGNQVVVSNGLQTFALKLNQLEDGWETLQPLTPKKLSQPVGVFVDGNYCQWGGCTAKTATEDCELNLSGQCLGKPTTTLAPPKNNDGEDIFLGGAAAISLTPQSFVAVGGVNKDIFLDAVNHPKPGYMTHPAEWYRFNPFICIYENGAWKIAGTEKIAARAGTTLAKHGNDIYVIGGELKPGVRTPDIYRLTFK